MVELAKRIPVNRTTAVTASRLSVAAVRRQLSFPVLAPTRREASRSRPSPASWAANYDTDWARRYPARVARLLLLEGVVAPALRALAAPTIGGLDRLS